MYITLCDIWSSSFYLLAPDIIRGKKQKAIFVFNVCFRILTSEPNPSNRPFDRAQVHHYVLQVSFFLPFVIWVVDFSTNRSRFFFHIFSPHVPDSIFHSDSCLSLND